MLGKYLNSFVYEVLRRHYSIQIPVNKMPLMRQVETRSLDFLAEKSSDCGSSPANLIETSVYSHVYTFCSFLEEM